jgi:signal transduction histidine kinase
MDLYYLPVLIGALTFGLRGAIITYLTVVFLHLPYILVVWHLSSTFLAEDLLHTLFFGVFAIIAGVLVDRERRWRKESENNAYLAALGRVAAIIAHELRSPLTVTRGFVQRIREKKGDAGVALNAISDAAETMNKILESTLDFAKPLRLSRKEEDIIALINRAVSTCVAKAENHGVSVSLDLPPEPSRIALDGFLCERALVNLIDNAIDASRRGQTIMISARPGGESVMIRIKDHGSGMDRDTLDNVFLPFYTTKSEGTGVGMAITKKIIDEHGGTIRVQSQPGRGTEINIRLPYQ